MAKQKKNGNCYENAFKFAVHIDNGWDLVHGICILTGGELEGQEFGHAWCEKGDNVYDAESGKELPKVLYYAVGNIGYTHRYTVKEARKMAVKTGNYGAWDKTIQKALHS